MSVIGRVGLNTQYVSNFNIIFSIYCRLIDGPQAGVLMT